MKTNKERLVTILAKHCKAYLCDSLENTADRILESLDICDCVIGNSDFPFKIQKDCSFGCNGTGITVKEG